MVVAVGEGLRLACPVLDRVQLRHVGPDRAEPDAAVHHLDSLLAYSALHRAEPAAAEQERAVS